MLRTEIGGCGSKGRTVIRCDSQLRIRLHDIRPAIPGPMGRGGRRHVYIAKEGIESPARLQVRFRLQPRRAAPDWCSIRGDRKMRPPRFLLPDYLRWLRMNSRII